MTIELPPRELLPKETTAHGDHAHQPTSTERWAEESPAYGAPVEYRAEAEDDFWKANHQSQSYARETSYGFFAPAYRAGYEGYAKDGAEGRTFEETELTTRQDYEQHGGKLEWTAARPGALAAWNRLAERHTLATAR